MLHTGKNTPLKQICKLPTNNSKPLSSSLTGNEGTSLISPSRHGGDVAMGGIDRSRDREEEKRKRKGKGIEGTGEREGVYKEREGRKSKRGEGREGKKEK